MRFDDYLLLRLPVFLALSRCSTCLVVTDAVLSAASCLILQREVWRNDYCSSLVLVRVHFRFQEAAGAGVTFDFISSEAPTKVSELAYFVLVCLFCFYTGHILCLTSCPLVSSYSSCHFSESGGLQFQTWLLYICCITARWHHQYCTEPMLSGASWVLFTVCTHWITFLNSHMRQQ